MLDPKLIDWIKSEEAKKIPDKKFRVQLIKEGWPEKDVDKAINLAHKGKVNWMPVILIFISSLILFFIVNSITKPYSMILLLLFGSALALIYTGVVYYNSNKKELFVEFFIVHYSSGFFALSLTILFFNLLVFLVHITGIAVTVPILIIIPSLSIILLIYVFYFTVALISKLFVGYFDYNPYFIFKHWPFKICNVDWNKKLTLLKYPLFVIVVCLVITGIILNFYLVQVGSTKGFGASIIVENNLDFASFSDEQLQLKIVQEVQEQKQQILLESKKPIPKLNLFNTLDLIFDRYISITALYHRLFTQKTREKVIHYLSSNKISLINKERTFFVDDFENGLSEWSSNNKTYVPGGNFWHIEEGLAGNQVMEGFGHIWIHAGLSGWKVDEFKVKVKILEEGAHINFIHRNHPQDGRYFLSIEEGYLGLHRQYNDWTTFEKIDDVNIDLKKGVWYNLRVEINHSNTYPIVIYVDDKAVIKSTHKPIYDTGSISFETLDDSIIWFDDVKVLSNDNKVSSYSNNQYNVFEESEENLTKYLFKLKNNIEQFYPQYLKIDSERNIIVCGKDYSFWNLISFSDSVDYLLGDAFYFGVVCERRLKFESKYFEEFYQTKDVEESLQSKVIRLKIIETFLARSVANGCQEYQAESWEDYEIYRIECYNELAELTGSPQLFLFGGEIENVS